jgi:hypothetical protein
LYDYDTNAILTEPLKKWSGSAILSAYIKLHQYLTQKGFQPQWGIHSTQGIQWQQQRHIPTCPATHAQTQCSRTSHQNMEKSLRCWTMQHGWQFSHVLMGLPTRTGYHHI